MLQESTLTAEELKQNLIRAAAAHAKGRKTFDEELDKLYPERPASGSPAK